MRLAIVIVTLRASRADAQASGSLPPCELLPKISWTRSLSPTQFALATPSKGGKTTSFQLSAPHEKSVTRRTAVNGHSNQTGGPARGIVASLPGFC
ncbi:hypothetical protein F4779DRAFT_531030 [Xylariaceae sp. FL0662B]|nr:hypothetical protein F4779DRAFT_531030 [Xylariaceae sp. FL0662B]